MTRRALVLTDETARHSFLASLPPHVRKGVAPDRGGLGRLAISGRAISGRDWREFFSAYCASFLAVMLFIA